MDVWPLSLDQKLAKLPPWMRMDSGLAITTGTHTDIRAGGYGVVTVVVSWDHGRRTAVLVLQL